MLLKNLNRRDLLRQLALMGGAVPMGLPMQAMAAASTPALNDYKALVCVYLHGGNDHFNTVVPYDSTNYNLLASYRPGLVPARNLLSPLPTIANQGGRQAAFHPELPKLDALYRARRLAVVHGLAPMIEPVTRAELYSGKKSLPPAAGSHNDGNAMFHTLGREGTRYGWGGRMLDLLLTSQTKSTFASIAAGFTNAFGSGQITPQINVDIAGVANGLAGVDDAQLFGSSLGPGTMRSLQGQVGNNLLQRAYRDTVYRLLDSTTVIRQALANSTSIPEFTGPDDSSGRDNLLGHGLRTIARLIQQQARFGAQRQVFYIELHGFDTHGGLVPMHGSLMRKINFALAYFQEQIDAMGLSNQVVTFTSSEFGRTLSTNGDGTDHGWGGLSLVMGSPVVGGEIYGSLPDMRRDSDDFQALGGGPNSIPKISVEQFGATLAKWFGVPDGQMDTLFPLLGRFSPRYLPFLG